MSRLEDQPPSPPATDAECAARIAYEWSLLGDPPPAAAPHLRRKAPLPMQLDDARIASAMRLMERNPAGPLSLDAIAGHVGLSPFHFQRTFLEAMGETPSAYIRRVRLDRAAMNLAMSEAPVLEIALTCGYASHEAFIRAFQRQFGLVPSQYRAFARQVSVGPAPGDAERAAQARVARYGAQRLLALRFFGPWTEVETYWRRFADVLRSAGIDPQACQPVGVVKDTPEITAPAMLRYDCAVVDTGLDVAGTALTPIEFEPGRYVSLRHQGPYAELFHSYRALSFAWLHGAGETFAADATGGFQFFHRPPWLHAGGAHDLDLRLPLQG
ncbi:AraC family transcriptional regulator [Xanthomonas translucens]